MSRLLLLSSHCLIFMTLCGACSHAPKEARRSDIYSLHQLIPSTLRVRRPGVAGADPKAGPGGSDYRTDPLPDARLDCKDDTWLFGEINLDALRSCIVQISAARSPALKVFYVVHRVPTPYLELEVEKSTPACLVSGLPMIPMPREIFFQSTEGGRLACYSSRFQIEANEVAGFKLPIDQAGVTLEFPMLHPPKDVLETRKMLLTWALTLFWNPSSKTLASHLATDSVCEVCLGERGMVRSMDPEPRLWPPGPDPRDDVGR